MCIPVKMLLTLIDFEVSQNNHIAAVGQRWTQTRGITMGSWLSAPLQILHAMWREGQHLGNVWRRHVGDISPPTPSGQAGVWYRRFRDNIYMCVPSHVPVSTLVDVVADTYQIPAKIEGVGRDFTPLNCQTTLSTHPPWRVTSIRQQGFPLLMSCTNGPTLDPSTVMGFPMLTAREDEIAYSLISSGVHRAIQYAASPLDINENALQFFLNCLIAGLSPFSIFTYLVVSTSITPHSQMLQCTLSNAIQTHYHIFGHSVCRRFAL
eukprot:TRINITY_DN67566_c5_g2_i1.p1 TRINITY_DN67566_c5_g2~~TRINITY_DN67566_c5_g2_i1.p1  ORF type:complete len:279 (-),score=2.14 TRINITY_DN67566_c5_g2_i1:206-997(-)